MRARAGRPASRHQPTVLQAEHAVGDTGRRGVVRRDRLVVAMTFNSDVGDSWEFADDPRYPDKYSELGIRIGVNYVVYSITH